MSIIRIMINPFLICFIFFLSSTVIAGEKNYECDINVMWVNKGKIHNHKRVIKLTSNEHSILLHGEGNFKFDKYLENENILVGIKIKNDKDFSSMSLILDTISRYKAIFSFTSPIDGYRSEEYHYGFCL